MGPRLKIHIAHSSSMGSEDFSSESTCYQQHQAARSSSPLLGIVRKLAYGLMRRTIVFPTGQRCGCLLKCAISLDLMYGPTCAGRDERREMQQADSKQARSQGQQLNPRQRRKLAQHGSRSLVPRPPISCDTITRSEGLPATPLHSCRQDA